MRSVALPLLFLGENTRPLSRNGLLCSRMRTGSGGFLEETVESVVSQREVDSLRLALAMDREEFLSLREELQADAEDHLSRLLSLLSRTEADRPAASSRQSEWLRSIDRMVPADRTGTLDSHGIGGT